MPAAIVRSLETFQAVHTSDSDWEDVVRDWIVAAEAPEEAIDGLMRQLRDGVEQAGLARPWLLNTSRGLAIVPPHDFANHYEDVAATDVLAEVFQELAGHADKGFDITHDDAHNTAHFVQVIRFHLDPLAEPNNVLPDAVKRREFIKAASVAVAAVHKIDRAQDVRTHSVD